MRFDFTIQGDPVPKGSRTAGTRKNGTRYTRESSKRVKPWMVDATQELFAQQAAAGGRRFNRATSVHLIFYCHAPNRPTHAWPSIGDIDKFCRAVLDALTQAGVLLDDRHVISLTASKQFTTGEPRTVGWVEDAEATPPAAAAALRVAA